MTYTLYIIYIRLEEEEEKRKKKKNAHNKTNLAYETVQDLLFECPKLSKLRKLYLPTPPNIDNTLYGQYK